MVIFFLSLLGIIGYFLVHGYFTQLSDHEEKVLAKVKAISATLAGQIDAEQHNHLFGIYKHQDDIMYNEQDSNYMQIHLALIKAQTHNNLNTDIYTMVIDSIGESVVFGVSTSEKPFFRHRYEDFPRQLIDESWKGAKLAPYEDENGHWLSAFTPIRNSEGTVVGVVQVDETYDDFIEAANKEILRSVLISLGIMLVIAFVLLQAMRKILSEEQEIKKSLVDSKREIEEKNRDITDSIRYARRIQEAVAPSSNKIREALPESFVLYLPRDIVSGDFYWFAEKEDKILIAAVDCTGHGVPGAFMSMMGNMLLNEIVNQKNIVDPGQILDLLDKGVRQSLMKDEDRAETNDGMDVSLCVLKKDFTELEYAGAFRPLIYIRDGEPQKVNGDKFAIGGNYENKCNFTTNKVAMNPGDAFYIFSDGYPDQFGGPRGKKFMTGKFRTKLVELHEKDCLAQFEDLQDTFDNWKGTNEQVDDVLVIGFKLPKA